MNKTRLLYCTYKYSKKNINFLVPYEKFRVIRKFLKQETLMFLGDEGDEISRLEDK